jgi:hypothetical protein
MQLVQVSRGMLAYLYYYPLRRWPIVRSVSAEVRQCRPWLLRIATDKLAETVNDAKNCINGLAASSRRWLQQIKFFSHRIVEECVSEKD